MTQRHLELICPRCSQNHRNSSQGIISTEAKRGVGLLRTAKGKGPSRRGGYLMMVRREHTQEPNEVMADFSKDPLAKFPKPTLTWHTRI